MTFVLAVLAFPLLVAVLSLGVGLLLERLGGWRLPAALVLPLGFAGIVGLTQLTTWSGLVAPTSPVLVILVAVAGAVLTRRDARARWRDRRAGWWWPLGAGAGAYAIANGPVIAAGRPTFPGYLLDTTGSVQLIGAQRLVAEGRSWAPPNTGGYGQQLYGYFGTGYPSGSHSAFGSLGALVPVDLIWLYAPYLAVTIAFTALVLTWIAGRVGLPRWSAAVAGCLASVPALVYAYLLQGSIKEIVVLPALMLLGALVLLAREQWDAGPRGAIPLAVTVAAGWGVIGLSFTPWAAVAAVAILAAALAGRGLRPAAAVREVGWRLAWAVPAVVLLALPTVAALRTSIEQATSITDSNAVAVADPGNLLRPLLDVQLFGVWINASHRVDPGEHLRLTYLLIGVVVVAVAIGIAWLVRERRWALLAWIGSSVLVWLVLDQRATPWTAAKLLVLLSPIVILVAFVGAFGALGSRRLEGLLLAGGVALGVLLSDATLYHGTGLAPTGRFDELRTIGERFGDGAPEPRERVTLVADFDEYATYLLRDMAPDMPGAARRAVPWILADGAGPGYGATVDLDELDAAQVRAAGAIVVRRSGFKSRPPAGFRRTFHGSWYDVWLPEDGPERTVLHAPFGEGLQPASVPACRDVGALARSARAAGATALTAAVRPRNAEVRLARADIAGAAALDPNVAPPTISWSGPATVTAAVEVPEDGTYRLWSVGNVGRQLTATIDGRRVGAIRNQTGGRGNALDFGTVDLTAGRHQVTLVRGGGTLRPGDADATVIGGLVLAPEEAEDADALRTVPLERWRSLCGESVDWIDARR